MVNTGWTCSQRSKTTYVTFLVIGVLAFMGVMGILIAMFYPNGLSINIGTPIGNVFLMVSFSFIVLAGFMWMKCGAR